MLIFDNLELVYLAAPKTGSTSFEMAFRRYANQRHSKALPKHSRYGRFQKAFPDLAERYEVVTCVRDPLETLDSWYRYRSRSSLRHDPRSTSKISFAEFYDEWCKDDPKLFASMKSSVDFVLNGQGIQFPGLKVIRYGDTAQLFKHVEQRLGVRAEAKRRNVSPEPPGPGFIERLKRLLGQAKRVNSHAGDRPSLSELRASIDVDRPRLRKAYEDYDRIRFSEVSDLRSDVLKHDR